MNIGAELQTFLYAMNDTMTVLKIILLNIVSVITNIIVIVIPKLDKKTYKQKTRNQYASPPEGNAILAGHSSDFFYKIRRGENVPDP